LKSDTPSGGPVVMKPKQAPAPRVEADQTVRLPINTKNTTSSIRTGFTDQPKRFWLDLGEVKEVAEVRLNGQTLGLLWCFPWHVDITKAVKPTGNVLEIDVINLWANRVIGDLGQPKEKRFAKTHDVFRFDRLTKTTPLIGSGLLGPVTVQREQD